MRPLEDRFSFPLLARDRRLWTATDWELGMSAIDLAWHDGRIASEERDALARSLADAPVLARCLANETLSTYLGHRVETWRHPYYAALQAPVSVAEVDLRDRRAAGAAPSLWDAKRRTLSSLRDLLESDPLVERLRGLVVDCGQVWHEDALEVVRCPRFKAVEELVVTVWGAGLPPRTPNEPDFAGEAMTTALASAPWLRGVRSLRVRGRDLRGGELADLLAALDAPALVALDLSPADAPLPTRRRLDEPGARPPQLGPSGRRALGRLAGVPRLERLRVADHALDAPAVQALLERCPRALVELDLSDNPIGDDAAVALASSAPVLPSLRRLNLAFTGVTSRGLEALLRSPLSERLEGLQLGGNPLDDACAALLAAPGALPALRALWLSGNAFSALAKHTVITSPQLAGRLISSLSWEEWIRGGGEPAAGDPSGRDAARTRPDQEVELGN